MLEYGKHPGFIGPGSLTEVKNPMGMSRKNRIPDRKDKDCEQLIRGNFGTPGNTSWFVSLQSVGPLDEQFEQGLEYRGRRIEYASTRGLTA